MKILIVEDDFVSRVLLQKILEPYGACHIAVNGDEAMAAFRQALSDREPYDLICMDIMMPFTDGTEALRDIRAFERKQGVPAGQGVKVVLTTALEDPACVREACRSGGADAYIAKPVSKQAMLDELRKLRLTA